MNEPIMESVDLLVPVECLELLASGNAVVVDEQLIADLLTRIPLTERPTVMCWPLTIDSAELARPLGGAR